jgi:hypothetical protein
MAKRSAEKVLDEAFFDALQGHGFTRLPGERLSFVRGYQNGSRWHLDVELRSYLSGFGVTLQDVSLDAPVRRQLLEEFRGLRAYMFDTGDPISLDTTVAEALADLHLYGLPWFAGAPVATAATEAVKQATNEWAYREAGGLGRAKFRNGEYAEAVAAFERAQSFRPLDPVDEKYRSLAERNARPNGG